jgi:hypothetical protein
MEINKLDVQSLKRHSIVVIIGKRGTGKSVMLCDMLSHFSRRLDYGVAFTPTESSAEMFARFMPRSSIYDTFDSDVLERMIDFQRSDAHSKKRRSLFCVMDDCLYDKRILRCKAIREVFMNGRHHQITLLLCAQYMMDLSPDLRGNVDYCFCLRDSALGSRMKLYRSFFGLFDKYISFAKVMDGATENHSAIVMDNTGNTNDISGCVFWYRAAPAPKPFYIGRRSFYRLDQQHRVPKKARRRLTTNSNHVTMLGQSEPKRRRENPGRISD